LRLSWCVSATKGARLVGQARRYGPGNAILLNKFLNEHRKGGGNAKRYRPDRTTETTSCANPKNACTTSVHEIDAGTDRPQCQISDRILCDNSALHSGGGHYCRIANWGRQSKMAYPVDRYLLIASTVCFLAAVVHTLVELRAGVFRPMRFNFFAIGLGFIFQTAFLWIRGQELGRCPITNLFEVFVFLAWSVALVYMLVGPAYRLSLMGAFTAPLVLLLQGFALIAPIDTRHPVAVPANSWLEFHASMSLVAYGAFALACIAGVMYLLQERQLKTHQLHSIFYHLPPLTNLFAVITRLLWWGFALYTVGIVSGFFTGHPLPRIQVMAAIALWLLYAAILQARHLQWLAPRRVAALCIIGFSAALALLWGITFTAELHHVP
jgi:HemX protein